VAVDAFLNEKIPFLSIYQVVAHVMDAHTLSDCSSMAAVMEAADWARKTAMEAIQLIAS
jgi:1-deoxy-D-xylulose 5-phosphate reductoisomerase